MNERRVKEHCKYCGGEPMTWKYQDVLKKVCLICGKEFEARREEDSHRFNDFAREFNS